MFITGKLTSHATLHIDGHVIICDKPMTIYEKGLGFFGEAVLEKGLHRQILHLLTHSPL